VAIKYEKMEGTRYKYEKYERKWGEGRKYEINNFAGVTEPLNSLKCHHQ
jgi:hypothetical protein